MSDYTAEPGLPAHAPLRPGELVTRYEVSCLPVEHQERARFALTVEWRGERRWAVCWGWHCADRDGGWAVETRPLTRIDAWFAAHRFDLHDALALARRLAPTLVVGGRTVADALERGW